MKYPKYPIYKDSGVKWLGEIPSHWGVKRLKFLCDIQTGNKDTVDAVEDGLYPFFVRSQTIERINSYTFDCEAILTAGDGVGVGKVFHYHNGPFDFHQRVYMLNEFRDVTGRYLYHFLKQNFYKVALGGGAKSTVDSLRMPLFLNFPIAVPPKDEQDAVVAFIDQETDPIDTLITRLQKLLDLLQEKRCALISHVVTKGLNPNAPRYESSIGWLGEVPCHWKIAQLRHVGHAFIGLTYDPTEVVDEGEGVLVLRSSNVQGGRIVFDDNVYVKKEIPEDLVTQVGDILICSRNGSRALIGKNATIDGSSSGLTFGAFMTVFRSPVNSFLYYVFNSDLFEFQSSAFLTSTINQLTIGTLKGIKVPVPPPDEQDAIVAFLDQQCANLDLLLEKITKTMSILQERRSALISAAVTGKIDVRGLAN